MQKQPSFTQPLPTDDIEIDDAVIVYGRKDTYLGLVLDINMNTQQALVRVWDTDVDMPYTAWWDAEYLELYLKATTATPVVTEIAAA